MRSRARLILFSLSISVCACTSTREIRLDGADGREITGSRIDVTVSSPRPILTRTLTVEKGGNWREVIEGRALCVTSARRSYRTEALVLGKDSVRFNGLSFPKAEVASAEKTERNWLKTVGLIPCIYAGYVALAFLSVALGMAKME